MAKEDKQNKIEETVQKPIKGAPAQEKPKEAKKDRKITSKSEKKPARKSQEKEDEIKHLVRIAGTDLQGDRGVLLAMTGIKGINRRVAEILVLHSGVDPKTTIGYLDEAQIEKLQSSVDNISNIIPKWMMNRQNELLSGEYKHLIGTDVYMSLNEDLNTMKKTRSYKGLRHEKGLRVRGQRTRSTGRKGITVGVSRSAPKK